MASVAREFTVDYHGFTYRGQTNNTIDWCVYFLKNFSTAEASLVQRVGGFVRRRGQRYVCMDVGANVGHRTLTMACFADEVVAIEPMPGAFERLSEKVALNALNHVKPFRLALSDQTEDVDFEVLSPSNFLAVRRSDVLTCGVFGTQTLSAVRGDDFIRDQHTQPPHFIRFAVGGETTRALEGLSETLRSARPVVFIECPP
ncbi:MAG: FkbM family methyltransferase, partial [Rhodospirillales bacterium]|nr:FkbM family methyltransferase [Rhodospirillales bacterium]